VGEVVASVRVVIDPSKTAGEDVVGATDISTEGSTPAFASVVDSIKADAMGGVVINVGVFDPSAVVGRDAVSEVEIVANGVGEEDSNNTATVGDFVVTISATAVGDVVVVV
jgi:hypothetical protein